MKKLMLAAAIVCAAAMSQAAAISWASGALKDSGGTVISGATASLYTITEAQYNTWLSAITADQATGMQTVKDALAKETAAVTGTSNTKGIATLTDPTDISTASSVNPIDLYAAVVYTHTDSDGKDWYIANVGTYTAIANSTKSVNNMGLKVGGSGATISWQSASVPEPTSGLLLALGLAGLALRRRRA